MRTPEWVKPSVWGLAGGAVAAMVIGFGWGGWVTGGTARQMANAEVEQAVVHVYAPVCAKLAAAEPEKLALLVKESSWQRDSFVVKAGWVEGVQGSYRSEVAEVCAEQAVKAYEAKQASAKPAAG